MSPLGMVGLVIVAAWLGVLTLAVLLLTRQLGVILARLQEVGVGIASMGQGMPVGERVPREVRDLLLATPPTDFLLLITTSCDSCRDLVQGLAGADPGSRIVTLIPGDALASSEIATSLHPAFTVISDPEASAIAERIGLNASPYVMGIEEGVVTRKSFVHGPDHLLEFVGRLEPSIALLQIENGSMDAIPG